MDSTPLNSETGPVLIRTACDFAIKAHEGQFRADGKTPYINHPLDVMQRFYRWYLDGGYRNLAASDEYRGQALAIAHDSLEDGQNLTMDDLIRAGLGAIVPEMKLLTHKADSYLDYLLAIRRSGNALAIAVKLCDIESNLADVDGIPSAGRRKSARIKGELARYVLTHP